MTTTRDIVDALVAGNIKEAKQMTSSILSEKIKDACDLHSVEVTEKRYNSKKEDKLDPVDHSELKGKHKAKKAQSEVDYEIQQPLLGNKR